MARTTANAVKAIIDVDQLVTDITPFIDTANSVVTQVCASSGYTDATLELIERWLSAHFYAARDPRLQAQQAGGAGGTYEGQAGMFLRHSVYGQMAMTIDTAGNLAKLDMQMQKGRVVGGITHLTGDKPAWMNWPWGLGGW